MFKSQCVCYAHWNRRCNHIHLFGPRNEEIVFFFQFGKNVQLQLVYKTTFVPTSGFSGWFFSYHFLLILNVRAHCTPEKKTHWNAIAQTWNNGQKERTKNKRNRTAKWERRITENIPMCAFYTIVKSVRERLWYLCMCVLKRKGNRERERAPKKEQNLTETFWTRVLFEFLLKMWFSRMEWIFIHTSIQN